MNRRHSDPDDARVDRALDCLLGAAAAGVAVLAVLHVAAALLRALA